MPSRSRAGFWLLAQLAVVLGAVLLPDDWRQRGAIHY
jgi:hypothetical protein